MEFGSLVVFRNNKKSAPYELDQGEHSIGSSVDSNIRLKFLDPLLMPTHAVISVNEDRIASITSQSFKAPVKVNGKNAIGTMILKHEDQFEILGKVFQYFNEHLKNELENNDKFVKAQRRILDENDKLKEEQKRILDQRRRSVHPLLTSAKKSPHLKPKIPEKPVDLIDLSSPSMMTENSNDIKTPINKRIKSLKAIRHSLKKDTPPPKLTFSQKRRAADTSLNNLSMSITYSPLAEPRRSETPRRSAIKKFEESNTPSANRSRVSFAVEAPTEASPQVLNESYPGETDYSEIEKDSVIEKSGRSSKIKPPKESDSRITRLSQNVSENPNLSTPEVINRRSTRAFNSQSIIDGVETTLGPQPTMTTDANISNNIKDTSRTSLSLFDESTQEARSKWTLPNNNKVSRLSRDSPRSSNIETSQTEGTTTDEENVNKSSNVLKSPRRRTWRFESPANSSQIEDDANKSARMPRNTPRSSTKVKTTYTSSETEDDTTAKDNANMTSRVSRNASKRSSMFLASINSQIDDNAMHAEGNANKSPNVSETATRRTWKFESPVKNPRTDDTTRDEVSAVKSLRVSKTTKMETSVTSQSEDNNIETENANNSSRVSRNISRRKSKIETPSQDTTTDEDDANKSLRVSGNMSGRNSKIEFPVTSQDATTDIDNVNHSSRVSRNMSRRSSKIEISVTSQDTTTDEDNANKSSRVSGNMSRRSSKIEIPVTSHDTTTDEDNANKSSRVSTNMSKRNSKIETHVTTQDTTTDEDDANTSRVSRNMSRRNSKIKTPSTSQDTTTDEDSANHSSRVSRNMSKRSSKIETPGTSQDTTTDEDNANHSSRVSRNMSKRNSKIETPVTSQDTTTDESNANHSSRVSRNMSRRNSKIRTPATSQDTTTDEGNANKSSGVSRNMSGRNFKIETPVTSQDTTTDEDNANKSSRVSGNMSGRNFKNEIPVTSQDTTTDEDNDNHSSRVSRNMSKRSSKIETPVTSQDTTTDESNANHSSRVSRNMSRRNSKIRTPATSQDTTTDEGNANKSSRVSGNMSGRNFKIEIPVTSQDTTTDEDNDNHSSRVSRNMSKRNSKIETPVTSQDTTTDESNVNHSSRVSRNMSRRNSKIRSPATSQDTTTDEGNANKSSAVSRNMSGRNFKIEIPVTSQDTSTDENNANYSSRVSRNISKRSSKIETPVTSQDTTTDESNANHSSRVSRNMSRRKSKIRTPATSQDTTTDEDNATNSSRVSRSRSRNFNIEIPVTFQSEVITTDEENVSKSSIISRNTSIKSFQIDFDESTQDAKPTRNLLKKKSHQRMSIFDESTTEVNRSRSLQTNSIIDDTQSQKLQDSSLTTTSMSEGSSLAKTVSSQSFSSFKKGEFENRDETEIDVVNISSMCDETELTQSFRGSLGNAKEVLEDSNASRSTRRQSRTFEMFRDVSYTSTPFHKQDFSKRSHESESADSKNVTKKKSTSSSVILIPESLEAISISSGGDSVFVNSSGKNKVENILEESGSSRRSSRRSSVSMQGAEHNCVSCRNSLTRRSSAASESSILNKSASTSFKPSKTPRKSDNILEEISPVKSVSSAASSKVTTPLLHRKSLATSLLEKTPEKCMETDDETPKSSIKPTRRSSKANQSAYNPTLEDITPVTPEKLMVSAFTEDVFKTPINTPGLFENIRKSAIRSRKRHRDSTGSAIKDSKRARVDFPPEEQDEENAAGSPKPQQSASPKNDLTNVAGVKKMFTTPKDVKSPKNDLTNIPNLKKFVSPRRQNTPKNDLTQIPNLRRIMSPRRQNSPKNDLSAPVGVKRLLRTPRVEREHADDLGNVTGVANMFNVSGVEVLHQGSDIENSEDLFTQLTGKRPLIAYPRGKSLSPNKKEEQETYSRKTMGDIPICSPRVQQWIEDHVNVNYAKEKVAPRGMSDGDDVFFHVSEKPTRRSRSGRSMSPKKPLPDTKNRRKTQGDGLEEGPNIPAWDGEQAVRTRTRKSSTSNRNAGINVVTPTRATRTETKENTPQPEELVTLKDGATSASVSARRGRSRPANNQDEPDVNQQETDTLGKQNETPKIVQAKKSKSPTLSRNASTTAPVQVLQTTKTETSQKNKLLAVEESASPTRNGRSRRANNQGEPEVDQQEANILGKQNETPKIVQAKKGKSPTLSRDASTKTKTETSQQNKLLTVEKSASPARKGRSKRANNQGEPEVDQQEANILGKQNETPKIVQAKKGKSPTLSRDASTKTKTETSQQNKLLTVEKSASPARKGRSKRANNQGEPEVDQQEANILGKQNETPKIVQAKKGKSPTLSRDASTKTKTETSQQNKLLTVEKSASPARKGRSKRANNQGEPEVDQQEANILGKQNETPKIVQAKKGKSPTLSRDASTKTKTETSQQNKLLTVEKSASPARKGRSRRANNRREPEVDQQEADILGEQNQTPKLLTVEESATPASVSARRGLPRQAETHREPDLEEMKQNEAPKTVVIDEIQPKVAKAATKRGRKRIMSVEELDVVTSASPVQKEPLSKKTRTRRGGVKLESVDQEADAMQTVEESVPTRALRSKPKNKITDPEVPEINALPMRRGGRRGKQADDKAMEHKQVDEELQILVVPEKPTSRSKRGRKIADPIIIKEKDDKQQENDEIESATEGAKAKGRAISKAKKGQKIDKENEDSLHVDVAVDSEEIEASLSRNKRGRKNKEQDSTPAEMKAVESDNINGVTGNTAKGKKGKKNEEHPQADVEAKKTVSTRRGRKENIKDESTSEEIGDAEVQKPSRSKRGKKIEVAAEGKEVVPEVKGKRKGRQNPIADEADEVMSDVEFNRPTRGSAKNTVPAKRGGKIDVNKQTEDVIKSTGKTTRNKGKKEEVTEEVENPIKKGAKSENTKKLRNKVIEEVIEVDVDSPRTARAKRGVNKKYSTDEYEVIEKNIGSKRKVHFKDAESTPEMGTRKSKRTRK